MFTRLCVTTSMLIWSCRSELFSRLRWSAALARLSMCNNVPVHIHDFVITFGLDARAHVVDFTGLDALGDDFEDQNRPKYVQTQKSNQKCVEEEVSWEEGLHCLEDAGVNDSREHNQPRDDPNDGEQPEHNVARPTHLRVAQSFRRLDENVGTIVQHHC